MKPVSVFIKQDEQRIDFYMRDDKGDVHYLFTQNGAYSSILEFFKRERRYEELRKLKKGPKPLTRLSNKLPKYMSYVVKYEA